MRCYAENQMKQQYPYKREMIFRRGNSMQKLNENTLRTIIFEILNMERKNLRSRKKTDQRMAEELGKVIVDYSKMRY